MQTINRYAVILWFSSVLLATWAGSSWSAEIKGVQFAESVTIHGNKLNLNGVAILKWARLFDVYAGALYLPDGEPGANWRQDIPKRLELSYFRDIEGKGFATTSIELLQRNLPPEEFLRIKARLETFCSLFRDVHVNDRYSINYVPGKGTELQFNNTPLGSVPGADFAAAYFGIWLGDKPISRSFRDRLVEG